MTEPSSDRLHLCYFSAFTSIVESLILWKPRLLPPSFVWLFNIALSVRQGKTVPRVINFCSQLARYFAPKTSQMFSNHDTSKFFTSRSRFYITRKFRLRGVGHQLKPPWMCAMMCIKWNSRTPRKTLVCRRVDLATEHWSNVFKNYPG